MADLTDLQSALSVKIAGADSAGIETGFIDWDGFGRLLVKEASTGPSSPGTASSFASLIAGVYNTALPILSNGQQAALQVDSNARLILSPNTSVQVVQATTPWVIHGNVSSGSTDSGNPVKIGGVYQYNKPIYTSGQRTDLQTSYQGALKVKLENSEQSDLFERIRTSLPINIFAATFAQSDDATVWQAKATGSGTVTRLSASAQMRLRTTTASGDSAIYQTRRYFRYQAGNSHRVTISIVLGSKITNVNKRVGYFDANNGVFIEQSGANAGTNGLAIVLRSDTGGSAVDTKVLQSDWNIDKMDGTGPSGLTIDPTKTHIFVFDWAWHGASAIKVGIYVDGAVQYIHQFAIFNAFSVPYTRVPNLPIRFEITNSGTVGTSNNDLLCAAASFSIDGASAVEKGVIFGADTAVTSRNATSTPLAHISIRPKTTFGGVTNRSIIIPSSLNLITGGNTTVLWRLYLNPALTGAVWVSADTNSAVEYDVSSTAVNVTNARLLQSGYVVSGTNNITLDDTLLQDLFLSNDIDGTTTEIFSVVLQTPSQSSASFVSLSWREIY